MVNAVARYGKHVNTLIMAIGKIPTDEEVDRIDKIAKLFSEKAYLNFPNRQEKMEKELAESQGDIELKVIDEE